MKEGLGSELHPKGRKNHALRPRRPCRIGGKPLYQPQLIVLIRPRIESGPVPDPLFFITWTSPLKATLGSGSPAGSPQGPVSTQCTLDSPKTAKLDQL